MIVDIDLKASIFPRLDVCCQYILMGRDVCGFAKAGFDILKIDHYGMWMFASVVMKRLEYISQDSKR